MGTEMLVHKPLPSKSSTDLDLPFFFKQASNRKSNGARLSSISCVRTRLLQFGSAFVK